MDINLWSLDFSERVILPASSTSGGYSSMNATIDFCGNGSFEAKINSNKVEEFVQAHPEGYFICWGVFQGFATDYQFKPKEKRIFGSHLNSILHKIVVEPYITTDKSIASVLSETIGIKANWLTIDALGENLNKLNNSGYNSEKPMFGDKFIQEYLATLGLGYSIYISEGQLHLAILEPIEKTLTLSENNLNIYEMQVDFSNKDIAFGGWYKHTEDDEGNRIETDKQQWVYIPPSDDSKSGTIYGQDIVLNSTSPNKAQQELDTHKYNLDIACKTRNIEYDKHYTLGNVVKLRQGNVTQKKQITSVKLWYEGCSYHTEPTLTEWEG